MKDNTVEMERVVSRDPEIHSGDLVFSGTRVPLIHSWIISKGGITLKNF